MEEDRQFDDDIPYTAVTSPGERIMTQIALLTEQLTQLRQEATITRVLASDACSECTSNEVCRGGDECAPRACGADALFTRRDEGRLKPLTHSSRHPMLLLAAHSSLPEARARRCASKRLVSIRKSIQREQELQNLVMAGTPAVERQAVPSEPPQPHSLCCTYRNPSYKSCKFM
ncbi:hypothetical protein FHG87_004410 [Trinorchestia longiramus]|nr:hypothetical protein FHG87_004410 [Trinorchestia longiramus]